MASYLAFLALIVIFLSFCDQLESQSASYDPPHRKFEYKYSFKGPYLAQKDGTVPFWEYDGNAIASDDMVRITPSLRSKRGSIWTKQPITFTNWEVELWLRVTGRGRLGADGIAFWYTDGRGHEGPVFGSGDNWRGLGVFFDSFDNDGKGNNPYVMAMLNDGSKNYDHGSDGSSQQMAGCLRDFRNKPFPVRVKIEYYNNILTVLFHSGNSNNEDEYELCLRAENVHLPPNGYFGISAATGGLADDHDALKFLTTSLHPPGSLPAVSGTQQQLPSIQKDEKDKMDKQYSQFLDNLEKQKEQFFKDHPEEAAKYRQKEESDANHEYETLGDKELQQIFDSQSQMYQSLQVLNRKLDEILGRQERTLSLVGAGAHLAPGGQVPQQTGGVPMGAIPIQRHEFESLLGSQREILQNSRDIRTYVTQPGSMQAAPGLAAQAQPGPGSNALHSQLLTEIRDGVNVLRKEMAQVGTRFMAQAAPQHGSGNCPPIPSCTSPALMGVLIVFNLFATIGYFIWRDKKDVPKKFY